MSLAGDLLRAEQQREGSEYGQLIADHIKEGKIVPQEVTIALLQNAMREAIKTQGAAFNVAKDQQSKWADEKGRFLIDGFPRKMDQALGFDDTVSRSIYLCFNQSSINSPLFFSGLSIKICSILAVQ